MPQGGKSGGLVLGWCENGCMSLWKIQVGDEFSPAIFEALAARGVRHLPDELDGEGTPMRVLELSGPSRDDALDVVCDVLDEHSYFYSYFNVTRADQTDAA